MDNIGKPSDNNFIKDSTKIFSPVKKYKMIMEMPEENIKKE